MADEYYDFYNPSVSDWFSGLGNYLDLGDYGSWNNDISGEVPYSYSLDDPYSPYYTGGTTTPYVNPYVVPPTNPPAGASSDLLKALSAILGIGTTAAGKSTASTPLTQTQAATKSTPLTPESQQLAATMQGLLPLLLGQLFLNPAQQGIYGQMTGGGLQSYLNPVPAEYTDALKSLIAPTQGAIETSTSQALNRMAPRTLSLGPQVQNIISEVSAANTAEKQFANQIYQYLSNQATTVNTGYGTRAGAALQLAGAPQTQQAAGIKSIQDLIAQLITAYQGGATTAQTGNLNQVTQPVSFLSSALTGTGSSLLNNPQDLGTILGPILKLLTG